MTQTPAPTKVSLVPFGAFSAVIHDAMAFLSPAIAQSSGRESEESVLDHIIKGECQLWMMFNDKEEPIGAATTRVEQYPHCKMLAGMFVGGEDVDQWSGEFLENLERFAKLNSCAGVEFTGRPGWQRYLAKFGWDAPYVVCQKMFDKDEADGDQ